MIIYSNIHLSRNHFHVDKVSSSDRGSRGAIGSVDSRDSGGSWSSGQLQSGSEDNPTHLASRAQRLVDNIQLKEKNEYMCSFIEKKQEKKSLEAFRISCYGKMWKIK